MLVIPSVVKHLFSPNSDDRHDVEKQEEINDKTQTNRGILRISRPRPAGLELDGIDKGLQEFAEDTSKGDPSRIYRILPIFSGIMIPFSIMLSIPSLTGHWYIRTGADSQIIEIRPNPLLLDVAMAFSMGCGVLANMCIVVRFSERKIKLMTMLCILFLSLHDLINIPSVTIFGVIHRFDDGFTYGQSFWLTVCSTIFSTATNITLIYDYTHTSDFSHSGSGLTAKQRSLVIIVIVALCYVSLGSLLLAIMLKISFIDALYLSVVSIETIGFGDLHPDSTVTRIVVCLYIAGGILNLALAVAISREALLEAAAASFQARLKSARARQRERHIRSRWRAAVRWRLRALGKPMWTDDRDEERKQRVGPRQRHWYSSMRRVWRRLSDEVWREWEDPAWRYVYGPKQKRLNLEFLSQEQLETAALEAGAPLSELVPRGLKPRREQGTTEPSSFTQFSRSNTLTEPGQQPMSLTHVRIGGMVMLLGKFALALTNGTLGEEEDEHSDGEGDELAVDEVPRPRGVPLTRSLTMTTMTMYDDDAGAPESLETVERQAFYARLGVALTLFVVFWMAGAAIFMKTEKWAFGSAIYFCFVSFTTVGYGDFAPKTPAGRSIFVVWALLGVGTMTILISILAEAYSSRYKSVIRSEVYKATSEVFQTTNRPRFFEPAAIPNSGTDDTIVPITATTATTAFSGVTQCTPRNPRSKPSILFPTIERDMAKDAAAKIEPPLETLKNLPQDVLRHTDRLMALLGTRVEASDESEGETTESEENAADEIEGSDVHHVNIEILLSEVKKSLKQIADIATQALDSKDLQV